MSSPPPPVLDRILAWSIDRPLAKRYRYLAASVLIVAIAIVRSLFVTALLPWLLFIPAILAIALVFGQRVGVFASVASTVAAGYTIGAASQTFYLTQAQWIGSLLFLAVTTVMARVVGELRLVFRDARALNIAREEREAFLTSVLASSTDCIKVMDLSGRITFMSEGGMRVMEVSDFNAVKNCPWPDFWQDQGNIEVRAALAAAREGRETNFIGKADTFAGNPKWWDVSVSPIFGDDGKPARILSVSRDRTSLIEAQEQQRLLNGELSHRLKNMLALVQSVANQTFRKTGDVEKAMTDFSARLVALGNATDVLTSNAWHSATLDDVVRAGLSSVGDAGGRVKVHGPPIRLDAQVALALTLALHELTTNACKYGALSNEQGIVTLSWDHEVAPNSSNARFRLMWRERGGPPVMPPSHAGFGSKMIERSLQTYFRGLTALEFQAEGVVFRIDAPLPGSASANR